MSNSRFRVLLIEDNPADARIIRELLNEGGAGLIQLDCVDRLRAGIARLEHDGIAVVLLDLGLPDSQGLDTLERLQTAAPAAPVVVFSGADDPELALAAVHAGAQDYLIKGAASHEVLTRSLRYAIERKRLSLEQKQVEQRLRESDDQFRAVLESAPDAIVIVSVDGNISLANAQAERLFGYSRAEFAGQTVENLMPESFRAGYQRYRSDQSKASDSQSTGSGIVLMGVRKDGSEFPIEVSLSPIRTSNGSWVAATMRDITERRVAERQLVFERLRAEEANRSKSAFLAAMSHEIRSPMNAILGMSELLWESDLNPEQRRYVEIFRRAGSNLLTLIDDILDLSKIEAGQLELEQIPFTLEEVMNQALELMSERARRRKLSLSSSVAPGVLNDLIGDPTRLRQVLINLLGNAIKFTQEGEVKLSVLPCESEAGVVLRFDVSDTGMGIPPAKLEMIFDDFTQADSTITRSHGGTGLGLGISRRIVERMGGKITVASAVGKGSTFSFTGKFEAGSRQATRSRKNVDDLFGKRALIVEDNPANLLFLRETFGSWGMEVRECKAASQALDELASGCSSERPYSLIVLGDQMPDSDEFLTASGMNPPATRVPIVMLTSKRKPGDNKNIERIGAAGYIETPIVRADLLRLIWDLLPDSQMAATPAPAGISDTSKGDAQRGLKILVAEDSADNRVLVEAYLHRTAHHLTFVDDGQKAVDRLTMEHFDLVLMDMQMPVMDGLAATRAIRLMEQQTSRPPTPVIALTANARQEDRVLSSQAGCNAHLSKPISKQRLLAAIAPYTPAGPVAAPTPAPIEIAIPEGLEALVPGYLEARKREVPEMLALLAATDFERLRRLGHNLKGTGESYGFAALTKFGAALEDAARNSNRAAAEVQVAKIGEYCSRVALVSESPTEE